MKVITIVVMTDTDSRTGVSVLTDAPAPAVGQLRNQAETLAMELLRICNMKAGSVVYGDGNKSILAQALAAGGVAP
jgi:hypothetical protein